MISPFFFLFILIGLIIIGIIIVRYKYPSIFKKIKKHFDKIFATAVIGGIAASGLLFEPGIDEPSPPAVDVNFTCHGHDGYFLEQSANYATAHDAATSTLYDSASTFYVGQRKSGALYRIYRAFVFPINILIFTNIKP